MPHPSQAFLFVSPQGPCGYVPDSDSLLSPWHEVWRPHLLGEVGSQGYLDASGQRSWAAFEHTIEQHDTFDAATGAA